MILIDVLYCTITLYLIISAMLYGIIVQSPLKWLWVDHTVIYIWLFFWFTKTIVISIDVCHFQVWWLLFPDWTQWVHKLTFSWWSDLATSHLTHLYGRVWNETLEDLSILSVWIDSHTTYTVQNNHRCAHTKHSLSMRLHTCITE